MIEVPEMPSLTGFEEAKNSEKFDVGINTPRCLYNAKKRGNDRYLFGGGLVASEVDPPLSHLSPVT